MIGNVRVMVCDDGVNNVTIMMIIRKMVLVMRLLQMMVVMRMVLVVMVNY